MVDIFFKNNQWRIHVQSIYNSKRFEELRLTCKKNGLEFFNEKPKSWSSNNINEIKKCIEDLKLIESFEVPEELQIL